MPYDQRWTGSIGELCREGRRVFYAFFIDGEYIENMNRDVLCYELQRRMSERRAWVRYLSTEDSH